MMAKVLDEFAFVYPKNAAKYRWDEWLDGRIWQLAAGTDFTIAIGQFRSAAFRAAQVRRLHLRTRQVDGDVVIQAYYPPPGEP
jgi:hypothetical protein